MAYAAGSAERSCSRWAGSSAGPRSHAPTPSRPRRRSGGVRGVVWAHDRTTLGRRNPRRRRGHGLRPAHHRNAGRVADGQSAALDSGASGAGQSPLRGHRSRPVWSGRRHCLRRRRRTHPWTLRCVRRWRHRGSGVRRRCRFQRGPGDVGRVSFHTPAGRWTRPAALATVGPSRPRPPSRHAGTAKLERPGSSGMPSFKTISLTRSYSTI
jgi:hypothetical protein